MTARPEEDVLQILDPVPSDSNEWPDFALRDAKIFYQGKGRYASLLEASDSCPLLVLGELVSLEDEQEYLAKIPDPANQRIKLEGVTNYAFGQDDDGRPVMWAAGKAGWYEISPSERYISHYNETAEAVDMFYFMCDRFKRLSPKRQRLGFQIDPFLKEYQKHTDYRVDDDDEAMEVLHRHHRFLLKQMIEEREEIDWSQTHLWNHLAEAYSDVVDELKTKGTIQVDIEMDMGTSTEIIDANSVSEKNSDDAEDEDESGEDMHVSSDNSESASSTKPSSSDNDPRSSPGSDEEMADESRDWTKPIFLHLNVLRKLPGFEMRTASVDDIAREVAQMPEFPNDRRVAVATLVHLAEPLLRLMNEAKLRKKYNWSTRAIYAELEATLADEIATDIKTPIPKPAKKKHRLKSVLRPSGAVKTNKRAQMEDDNDDTEHELVNRRTELDTLSSPVARRQQQHTNGTSRNASFTPSNGLFDGFDNHGLSSLPPPSEAQELMNLVSSEAKKHGRVNQVYNLQTFLRRVNVDI